MPLFVYEGEVVLVETAERAEEAVRELSRHAFLGFDTETRPSFRKGEVHPVCLLQLASPERVYLFRLNKHGFTPSLRGLLGNVKVVKIGVGIRDDIRSLRQLADFTPASFTDLQDIAEKYGIVEKSFSKLMAVIFSVRISKRQQVSNWEQPKLTTFQIQYAATDAWGALQMYTKLLHR